MAAEKVFKVILLGTIDVGKTSLIIKAVDGVFNEGKLENFEKKDKVINIDGQSIKLQITDTAGQERFRTLTSSYYRKAQAIIIVYDITNKESFDDLEGYIREGNRYSEKSEKFIVANKMDLVGNRVVQRSDGENLASLHGMPHFEVSAKTGDGVDKFFETVARKFCQNGSNEQKDNADGPGVVTLPSSNKIQPREKKGRKASI